MRKFLLLAFFSFIIFISCTDNAFESMLFRIMDDPFDDVPQTDSLKQENTVFLNWKEDIAADEYYLMKAVDSTNPNFSSIYQGNEISFIDTKIKQGERYLYRLDKKRGNSVFIGKKVSYGFGSDVRNDASEPNNDELKAVCLEYDLNCNLYCIQYEYKNLPEVDDDWFYIDVPPRRTAEVIIRQTSKLSNSNNGAPTNLVRHVLHESQKPVIQGEAIKLNNTEFSKKRVYFCISLDTTGLLSPDGGSTVIDYSISLNQIVNYQ